MRRNVASTDNNRSLYQLIQYCDQGKSDKRYYPGRAKVERVSIAKVARSECVPGLD